MTTSGRLYRGITAPQKATLTVTSGGLDLRTVTAVTWEVHHPGGAVVTWSASIVSATATRLVTEHLHASGDVWDLGIYRFRVLLTTPAGVVPCASVDASVTY